MRTCNKIGVFGATMLGIYFSQAAAAGPPTAVRTATVHAADIDVTSVPDVRVLYERIRYAAQAICTPDESSFDAMRTSHRRQCVRSAIDDAIDGAGTPLLTAIHREHSNRMAQL